MSNRNQSTPKAKCRLNEQLDAVASKRKISNDGVATPLSNKKSKPNQGKARNYKSKRPLSKISNGKINSSTE